MIQGMQHHDGERKGELIHPLRAIIAVIARGAFSWAAIAGGNTEAAGMAGPSVDPPRLAGPASAPETLKELVCDGPAAAMFHRRHGAGAAYRISASLDPADRFAWLGKTEAEAIQFLRHGIGSG